MNAVYCGKVRIGLSSNNYNYRAKETEKARDDNEFRIWASDIILVRGLVRVQLALRSDPEQRSDRSDAHRQFMVLDAG